MTHGERVHQLLYSCDDRTAICERVASLEELLADVHRAAHMLCEGWEGPCYGSSHDPHDACPIGDGSPLCVCEGIDDRMRGLGMGW